MSKQNPIEQVGVITEMLRDARARVKLDVNDAIILCTISGKMQKLFIKLVAGDKVKIEMSPYDLTKGRIVRRL